MLAKISRLIIAVICCFISVNLIAAPAPLVNSQVASDPTVAYVNQVMRTFLKENRIPGMAVELYINGKPYSFYYGVANVNTQVPVTDNTVFEIGSVTKLFTTLLVAMEINAGRMNLDDPITKYMPPILNSYAPINRVTIENLATHTAGLPYDMPKYITNQSILMAILSHWRPYAPVGSEWAYSNFGMGLLGSALESVTHENYDELYRTRILLPLKMNPIAFVVPDYLQALLAQGYDPSGGMEPYSSLDLLPASWAMKATGHDMLCFLKAAIGLPGTPPDIVEAMHLTQTPFVITKNMLQGLGWQIHRLGPADQFRMLHSPTFEPVGPMPATQISDRYRVYSPYDLIDKTGSMDGFRAYIAVIPNLKSGIVVLVNRGIPNGAIINTARMVLFKLSN